MYGKYFILQTEARRGWGRGPRFGFGPPGGEDAVEDLKVHQPQQRPQPQQAS